MRRRSTLIIVLAVLALFCVIILLGMLSKGFAYLLMNGLPFAFALFSFCVIFSLLTLISFFVLIKNSRFIRCVVLLLLTAAVFIVLEPVVTSPLLERHIRVFMFSVAVIFFFGGIIWIFVDSKLLRKAAICCGAFLMFLIGPELLGAILLSLYSPPAITNHGLVAMKEWIAYLQDSSKYNEFCYHLMFDPVIESIKEPRAREGEQLRRLTDSLYGENFLQVCRTGDTVMFYRDVITILPPGPGVLYSIGGRNPNNINNEQITKNGPYEKIFGNWYCSNNLTLGAFRARTQIRLPKGLIDRSLSLKGIDPNALILQKNQKEKLVSTEN